MEIRRVSNPDRNSLNDTLYSIGDVLKGSPVHTYIKRRLDQKYSNTCLYTMAARTALVWHDKFVTTPQKITSYSPFMEVEGENLQQRLKTGHWLNITRDTVCMTNENGSCGSPFKPVRATRHRCLHCAARPLHLHTAFLVSFFAHHIFYFFNTEIF